MSNTPVSDPEEQTTVAAGFAGDRDEAYCATCEHSFPLHFDMCPNDGTRLTKLRSLADALIGRVFDGRYEIRAALGEGGMGTVYRGCQLSVDREVAIKVIHPKLASDHTTVKRFLREARLASRLSQANIVNVYDFGQSEDGVLYLVMELLRGHTLAAILDQTVSGLAVKRILAIGIQLCDALQAAHALGIVHRDLKPGNIVVLDAGSGRDQIKVLDFGLAKSLASDATSHVTNSSALVGTPLYMAPEQIENKASDQRADLYSVGCILYHLVTGTAAYYSESINLVLAGHLYEPIPALPANVPPQLVALIEALLQKDPANRPGSALDVRAALEAISENRLLESGPVVPRPSMAPTQPLPAAHPISAPAPAAGNRRWLVLVLALAIAGVAATAVYVALARDDQPQAIATPAPASAVPPPATPTVEPIVEPVAVDAGVPDEPAPIAVDAGRRHRPVKRVTKTVKPDAGVRDPDVDFIRP
ncbi:MAG: protein kinase [Kofleriaceae bacterium]